MNPQHPDVTAALAAEGVTAQVASPDGRGYLLEIITDSDGHHIWIGAPEFLPEDPDTEKATGWVANYRDPQDDFLSAPYAAWDNPDPAPMAAAVAAFVSALH